MGLEDIIGPEVIDKDKQPVKSDTFNTPQKVVGLYFSAHWCPPCKKFTPVLADWYNKLKKSSKKDQLEIVFISSDRDEESFLQYFKEMPWHALPYGERDKKVELSQRFGVHGIPTLVFVDAQTGDVLSPDGRTEVSSDPEGENFPYWCRE